MSAAAGALRFSVIVPTYRRAARLDRCLAALVRQAYAHDAFEVIVADDGSGAPPRDVVARHAGTVAVTLVEAAHGGPGAARNAAAAHARGAYLAFTDDDCEPEPGWLAVLDAQLRATPHAAVGGRVENALPGNPFSAASQLLVSYLRDYYRPDARRPQRFFTTNNLAVSAAAFARVGGFDTVHIRGTAEDRDLCDRLTHAGVALVDAPDAVVYHLHDLGVRSFWRQHFQYGRDALYFHRARRSRALAPPRLEPPAFYLGMVRYAGRQGGARRAALQATLLALSQVAYAAGYVAERAARRAGRSASTAHAGRTARTAVK